MSMKRQSYTPKCEQLFFETKIKLLGKSFFSSWASLELVSVVVLIVNFKGSSVKC